MENSELSVFGEIKSNIYIIHLTGDITKDAGEFLLKWYNWENGLPNEISQLLVDFSKVSYINSAGIAALIRLLRIGKGLYQAGCYDLHYHYEKLFNMVGLTKYLKIYPSEWAAIEQINSTNKNNVSRM